MEQTLEPYELWRQQGQHDASQYQGCLNQQAAANYQPYPQAPLSATLEPEPPTIPTPEIPPMKPLKFIIFYALVAFGTFTWLYNHQEWGTGGAAQVDRGFISGFGAAGWPIYWSGRLVFAADAAITAAVPRVVEWWNAPAPDTSPVCLNETTGEAVQSRGGVCRFSEKHSETHGWVYTTTSNSYVSCSISNNGMRAVCSPTEVPHD